MTQIHALVIDDDALNIEVLSQLLALENVVCTTIQDPSRLVEVLRSSPNVDIVFLDLEMPLVDGYGVLDFLRNEAQLTIPIVACTVHVSEATTARKLGFDSFLAKPLNAETFSDQFQRIMNGERVWAIQPR